MSVEDVPSLAYLTDLLPGAWRDSPTCAGAISLRLTPRITLQIADPERWKTGPVSWGKIRVWDEQVCRDLHTTPTSLTVSNILNVAAEHVSHEILHEGGMDLSTLPAWLASNVIVRLGELGRVGEAAINALCEIEP